jgi:DNA-binding CsgD family transcriptional regulator
MPMGATAPAQRDSLMTPREGDVLQLLRQDHSNAQIALELHISIETVRSHARNIYRKLGVSSRRALLALHVEPSVVPAVRSAPARRRAGSQGARHARRH